jgi:alkanesulfonate monooxygenase SsuD/methylene tetrahydromethanopterin reductase-like flavin-dependent oxidoreductase (luciferase family)
MRYGVSIPNVGDPTQLVELAVTCEAAGWDGFFLWDHLVLDAAELPPALDPWVLMGAIAARTSTIKLGALVTPVPRRRPWKLAKEIATLDHLSGGRLIVGVGLGVPVDAEYAAFGEPSDPRVHASKLDEGLILLDGFLRGTPVDFQGDHYQVNACLRPASLQQPRPPIWVAATLPYTRGVRRARKWDGIFPLHRDHGLLRPDEVAELVAGLDAPEGYDVVTALGPGISGEELAAAGATWAIDGPEGPGIPFSETRKRLEAGPPR